MLNFTKDNAIFQEISELGMKNQTFWPLIRRLRQNIFAAV